MLLLNQLNVHQSKHIISVANHTENTNYSTDLQVKPVKMLSNHNNDSGMNQNSAASAIYQSPTLPKQPTMLQPYQGSSSSRSPPAFLMKTYAMVDDPKTNHIISWSLSGTSLIIWKDIKLAEEIIPQYFKHNNFSSFIYQLNKYGFRKIGLEKWEYENQWFQRGNKQLLLNIKRRDTISRVIKRRFSRKRSIDVANNEINNTQVENLRNHIAAYKEEIQKLKEKQALAEDKIALFKEHIKVTKDNSMKIITFLAKAYGDIIDKDIPRQNGEITVCKENGEIAENALTSDTEYSSKNNQLMEVNVIIPEANAPRSSQENSLWRKFLEVDMQDENEPEPDSVRKQFMLNMELDDMMEYPDIALIEDNESKPPKMEIGEVNLPLWT